MKSNHCKIRSKSVMCTHELTDFFRSRVWYQDTSVFQTFLKLNSLKYVQILFSFKKNRRQTFCLSASISTTPSIWLVRSLNYLWNPNWSVFNLIILPFPLAFTNPTPGSPLLTFPLLTPHPASIWPLANLIYLHTHTHTPYKVSRSPVIYNSGTKSQQSIDQ